MYMPLTNCSQIDVNLSYDIYQNLTILSSQEILMIRLLHFYESIKIGLILNWYFNLLISRIM
jgi:hypothetical protein